MKRLSQHALPAIFLLLLATSSVAALPDLRSARAAGPLTVYADDRRPALFYYPPGDLALAKSADNKPDLHFLQMRYTGNVSSGDRGTSITRSLLSFRVVMDGPTPAQLRAAKDALTAATRNPRIELRPLPISRVEAVLVYAPVASAAAEAAPAPTPTPAAPVEQPSPQTSPTPAPAQSLPGGHFEQADAGETADGGSYWTQRIYTLSLDENGSQLLWETFQRGQVAVSIGYAFYSTGIGPDVPREELVGSPELVAELRRRLAERRASETTGAAGNRTPSYLVRAGASSLAVEAKRWPELFRRVDVNQQDAPPGYAILDLYCYDFNNSLRPTLYEKQVEIEAAGVSGRPVKLLASFSRSQPDLYARTIRFPVAVRMDRPFRYRVHEVEEDGTTRASSWVERASWTEIIDVTTQAKPNAEPSAVPTSGDKP